METKPVRGRFAPSPSGRMHLGNIFCALMAWLPVRAAGGEMVLRIEDLDPDRSRMAYAAQIEDDLTWFGMDWDEGGSKGGPQGPYYQSQRTQRYRCYFEELRAKGLVYPCYCTRGELHAAQAPHREDGAPIYSGRCRSLTEEERARLAQSRRPAYRLMVPDREIAFTDGCQGNSGKTFSGIAGILSSGALTGCLLISWQWWPMMGKWGLPRWCADAICWIPRPGSSISMNCLVILPRNFSTFPCSCPLLESASPNGTRPRTWDSFGPTTGGRRCSWAKWAFGPDCWIVRKQ